MTETRSISTRSHARRVAGIGYVSRWHALYPSTMATGASTSEDSPSDVYDEAVESEDDSDARDACADPATMMDPLRSQLLPLMMHLIMMMPLRGIQLNAVIAKTMMVKDQKVYGHRPASAHFLAVIIGGEQSLPVQKDPSVHARPIQDVPSASKGLGELQQMMLLVHVFALV